MFDCVMPTRVARHGAFWDMDGRHVVRQIRQDPELKQTVVIAISGVRDPKEIEDIKKSGIDHYIPKPVSTKTFVQQIKTLI